MFVVATRRASAERYTGTDLYEIADKLRAELMKVENIRLNYIAGSSPQQIWVEPDPEKLALYGITLEQPSRPAARGLFGEPSVSLFGDVRGMIVEDNLISYGSDRRHREA
jgi:hypothetical protein